eukprot:m.359306 g.359306  ORF g.359306 m.359306 type:complete len:86 (+) comp18523_c0_seq1:1279-1536(+)
MAVLVVFTGAGVGVGVGAGAVDAALAGVAAVENPPFRGVGAVPNPLFFPGVIRGAAERSTPPPNMAKRSWIELIVSGWLVTDVIG